MHDHHGLQIVDPEIVILAVTQPFDFFQGLLLSGLAGHGASGFQALIVGKNATGGLDHVHGLLGLGLIQIVVNLLEQGGCEDKEHQHRNDENQP